MLFFQPYKRLSISLSYLFVIYLHIVLRKSTSAWSITAKTYSDVCNEVEKILEEYIDLFHEYCGQHIELPLYEPTINNHLFSKKIGQLKIPSTTIYRTPERPFLLLYNL